MYGAHIIIMTICSLLQQRDKLKKCSDASTEWKMWEMLHAGHALLTTDTVLLCVVVDGVRRWFDLDGVMQLLQHRLEARRVLLILRHFFAKTAANNGDGGSWGRRHRRAQLAWRELHSGARWRRERSKSSPVTAAQAIAQGQLRCDGVHRPGRRRRRHRRRMHKLEVVRVPCEWFCPWGTRCREGRVRQELHRPVGHG